MRRREFIALFGSAAVTLPFAAYAQQTAGQSARHSLSLTSTQRSRVWRSLNHEAMKTQVPAGLHVGEVVPDTMNFFPFARALRKHVPALRPYRYTLLHGQVLIIDPSTKKIVAIVSE